MPLDDTFVRQVKSTDQPAGDSYADGGDMYLLVKPFGKYWRMDYRYAGKRNTLARVCPRGHLGPGAQTPRRCQSAIGQWARSK